MRMAFKVMIWLLILVSVFVGGCGRNSNRDASDQGTNTPVTIGSVLPLTGSIASYGNRARNGMELAIEEISRKGKPAIHLAFEDGRGETSPSVAAARKLIDQQGVPVVIGAAASSVTMALTVVGNQNHVVIFTPIASSPELTTKGGPYFFRLAPSDALQARIMAGWFNELGYDKIAVLYVADTWGQSLYETVKAGVESHGGEVVLAESAQDGQADFRVEIEKFKRSNADAFYIVARPKDGGTFVKQAKQMDVKRPLFGADVWGSPEHVAVGGSAIEGGRFVAPAGLKGDAYDRFAEAFRKKYGEDPDVYAAYAYDTVMLFDQLAQEGARSGPEFRQALQELDEYSGVSGSFHFDENGDCVGLSFERYEYRNEKPVAIE